MDTGDEKLAWMLGRKATIRQPGMFYGMVGEIVRVNNGVALLKLHPKDSYVVTIPLRELQVEGVETSGRTD